MKATGIVRRIDDLGRVVIPKKIRRTMRIREDNLLSTSWTRKENTIEAHTGITKPRRTVRPAGSFFRSIFLFGVNLGVNGQKQKAKRPESLEISSLFTGAVGEIRTLARFNPPTPLAGEPLEPLGYYCKRIKINCCYSVVMFKWRREWDSNPRPFRVTGFQDRLLKPLGHLSSSFPIRSDVYSTIFSQICQQPKSKSF